MTSNSTAAVAAPCLWPAGPAQHETGWLPADPHDHPCRVVGDTFVVFEGPRRLIWERRAPDRWRPVRLWPDEPEKAAITARIKRGKPVVVVLEELPCSVPLLGEEAALVPPALERLVTGGHENPVANVPSLDWLPERERERGERFARRSREMIAANPKLLLSSYVIDPQGSAPPETVRFAVRTGARSQVNAELVVLLWN